MSKVAEQEFLHIECHCVPNIGPSHCHLCGQLANPSVWPCKYATAMAAHDERVRADERERCAQADTEAAFDLFVRSFNGDEAGDIDDVWTMGGSTGYAMRGGNDVRAVFEKAVTALVAARGAQQ